jgi:fatty-acyl-CoA synthase
MFKSGGYNVYPREIELCIERHPAVASCAVVAVPDELFGEVGYAFVVPHHADRTLDASEVKAWCSSHLANYKIPKVYYMAEELPRLSVEKIDKPSLKRWALHQLAGSGPETHADDVAELPDLRLLPQRRPPMIQR